jgi:energy-coupling factor transporter transmembrane protein EcfT
MNAEPIALPSVTVHAVSVNVCDTRGSLLATFFSSCRYVLFKFLFITVSRFSLSLASTVACVTFSALQLTSLFLITTPPEQAAIAFRWFVTPLRLVGLQVDTLTFQLLLALRFVSLVRSRRTSSPACCTVAFSSTTSCSRSRVWHAD